jgi:hypothetical protein
MRYASCMAKKRQQKAEATSPLTADEADQVKRGIAEFNREVSVPVRAFGISAVSCKPFVVESQLSSMAYAEFESAIKKIIAMHQDKDPTHIEALAGWAADDLAKLAVYYFLNVDLERIATIFAQTAMQISLRRAAGQLILRTPTGELGLRNDSEREMWRQLAEAIPPPPRYRSAVLKDAQTRLGAYMDSMKGTSGGPKGTRPLRPWQALAVLTARESKRNDLGSRRTMAALKTHFVLGPYFAVRDAAKKLRDLNARADALQLTDGQLKALAAAKE